MIFPARATFRGLGDLSGFVGISWAARTHSGPPKTPSRFAENQPFTPVIETLRALLTDAPLGDSLTRSIAWSAAIALLGYLWAKKLYNRDPGK
ncbi:hypothetical protein [Nonomuraea endophytica]|uniref:ABC-type polysaccharide/polyol phosphate export permease n=1 Tax=Nonomuraea endophytica TaxID=714136 RepID=A0A7W8A900_9ACTN|nr:hypothetical protein [Nonomuraea endophytica]MBB5081841.1 ABC-type polysaccharide/polyol phosphate export permease [Nonomuraea endophytica]